MIPKKIHWCWLSGEPLSEGAQECIASWKEHLPEYEIVLWDMAKIQNLSLPTIVWDAIIYKRWAVTADYIRLYAVYNEGGIYLDSDVKIFKPFDEEMLNSGYFTAAENWGKELEIQAAVFGGTAGHPFIKDCMSYYEKLEGTIYDNVLAMKIIAPWIHMQIAKGYGFRTDKDVKQILNHNMIVYPHHVFAGFWDQVTEESYCLHICHGGWRKKKTPKLLIGIPTSGNVRIETYESLWKLELPQGWECDLYFARNGYGVARNKNIIAAKAIDEGYDYIFTVDDDMTFPADTIIRLFAAEADIASAWAMQTDGTTNICRYDVERKHYQCLRPDEVGIDNAQYVTADAVGIACTLIKTEVYKRINYPYHVYHEYPNRTLLSEDLYLCDRLRTEAPDVKIKIDLTLKAGHIKQTTL